MLYERERPDILLEVPFHNKLFVAKYVGSIKMQIPRVTTVMIRVALI